MKIITSNKVIYKFSPKMEAIETIVPGETIKVETNDCFYQQIIRKRSIIISTILASIAQLLFIQNLGILNVYTAHLNLDIFSAAALLAGGATFKKANIKNALLGILLFHTLFVVSPLAGQNIFKNPALGECFRSFIAYGTIVFALMINLKVSKES